MRHNQDRKQPQIGNNGFYKDGFLKEREKELIDKDQKVVITEGEEEGKEG